MTKRIFRSILTVTLAVLVSSFVLIVGVLHGYFQDRVAAELARSTAYIARGVEHEGIAYLQSEFPDESRVTWIAADGTVLFDNREEPADMGNHADREEFREALALGKGSAARYSSTLSQRTLYYALRLTDGSVLRTASAQYSVWILVLQAIQPVAFMMLAAFCMALWLAGRVAQQLVEPINAIDLGNPGEEAVYEELSPLVGKIRSQNRQIQRQVLDLKQRREEFAAITENMSEGLLVVDQETRVLSYNSAALHLLGARGPVEEGQSVLALDREAGFRRCVEESLAGRRCEELLERSDDCRRVLASPVMEEGAVAGAVLIVLDVTEKEQRDRLRREFTANVSHELKTPLTSILGTAEILENGMVKPADIPHFAGNIHREAQRLIGLVNDIIKLSRLDEGGPTAQWETVDLYAQAQAVFRQLAAAAEKKQVDMRLTGESVPARGVPQIVEEILYNLCDNAVAYNHPGGSVAMTVADTPAGARVTVRDTGIGIPREARERVFERFYRVDKSHSSGGTGLGLSIVKHGAAYLGVGVTLESEMGKGSTFTLQFPKVSE
ncbi:ATP-binding protein [Oscillibacter sp.]|uniref:sensor histidine kinase n=1 Tax=Oscillibacter sp. TaxID=1945593 RepID=UPI002636EEB6|nr:ATP-binding protein [Oscillibacter sp.]MDD3347036.1 ATP-binding protein [Oscillibacter sp.]